MACLVVVRRSIVAALYVSVCTASNIDETGATAGAGARLTGNPDTAEKATALEAKTYATDDDSDGKKRLPRKCTAQCDARLSWWLSEDISVTNNTSDCQGSDAVNSAVVGGDDSDLDALAERVGDALHPREGNQDDRRLLTSVRPAALLSPEPSMNTKAGRTTSCRQNDDDNEPNGDAPEKTPQRLLQVDEPRTAKRDEDDKQTSADSVLPADDKQEAVGRTVEISRHEEEEEQADKKNMCGQGEQRHECNKGEECCNDSCGICAPRGQTCLRISCEDLRRGDGSAKVSIRRTGICHLWIIYCKCTY